MYYQQEPAFTLVIVFLIVGVFIFFKVKKKGLNGNLSRGMFGFGKGNSTPSNGMDPLSMLLFQQSFMNQGLTDNDDEESERVENRTKSIDDAKKTVLRLLKND